LTVDQAGGDKLSVKDTLLSKAESEFSRMIRAAAQQQRFGRVGLIVHMQAGAVKTLEKHDMETFR
jgi:hypothetical protein